jgi:cardiolipin synthase (CMP-forming)
MLLTPLIAWSISHHQCAWALGLMFTSGVTDAADGYLARRYRWQSRLGGYLDPIADKLLLVTVYISLGIAGLVPRWLVALVVGRDVIILAMVAAALTLTNYREFRPALAGKISTIVQIGAAVGLLGLCAMSGVLGPGWRTLCIWATAVTTMWSGIDYVARAARDWKNRERKIRD